MTNKNEIKNVDTETGEIVEQQYTGEVVRETDDYVVLKDENGKFVRRAKYNDYSSFTAETRQDKIWLLNLIQGDEEEVGFPLSEHVGKTIEVEDIIIRKYDRINEDTGETEYGVLTYLITPERDVYVTSSKTVHFSILRIMELFGKPTDELWENIKLQVGSERGQNGTIIKVKMVG